MKNTGFITIAILFAALFVQNFFAQATPSPQMKAANELVKQKKWTEAETAFASIVKSEPKNGRAWFMLGFSRHSQDKFSDAIKAFEKNVKIAKNPISMYNIAASYSRLGKSDKSFEWLEKALNNGAAFRVNLDTDKDFNKVRADARFAKMKEIVKQKRNPCMYSKESRQFDFWLGDWDVYVGKNKVGENLIELDTQGCTLVENWKNNGGGMGKSLNVYNVAKKKWQQFYVSGQGGVFLFEGDFRENDKNMYFTAETTAPNGGKVMHIFEFFDLPDKTVQQRWKQSTDEGKTWNTVWDSIYKKKAAK